jgi:hypothetical protein
LRAVAEADATGGGQSQSLTPTRDQADFAVKATPCLAHRLDRDPPVARHIHARAVGPPTATFQRLARGSEPVPRGRCIDI